MRFGISVPNVGDLNKLIELGVEADRARWDGFFLWDHMRFMKEFAVQVSDPWVALGAIAVRTERVCLGTLVTPVARRRPWKLARETVTLDHLHVRETQFQPTPLQRPRIPIAPRSAAPRATTRRPPARRGTCPMPASRAPVGRSRPSS